MPWAKVELTGKFPAISPPELLCDTQQLEVPEAASWWWETSSGQQQNLLQQQKTQQIGDGDDQFGKAVATRVGDTSPSSVIEISSSVSSTNVLVATGACHDPPLQWRLSTTNNDVTQSSTSSFPSSKKVLNSSSAAEGAKTKKNVVPFFVKQYKSIGPKLGSVKSDVHISCGDCSTVGEASNFNHFLAECVKCLSLTSLQTVLDLVCCCTSSDATKIAHHQGGSSSLPLFISEFCCPLSPAFSPPDLKLHMGKVKNGESTNLPTRAAFQQLLLCLNLSLTQLRPFSEEDAGKIDKKLGYIPELRNITANHCVFASLFSQKGLLFSTKKFFTELTHGERMVFSAFATSANGLFASPEASQTFAREMQWQTQFHKVGALLFIHLDHGLVLGLFLTKQFSITAPTVFLTNFCANIAVCCGNSESRNLKKNGSGQQEDKDQNDDDGDEEVAVLCGTVINKKKKKNSSKDEKNIPKNFDSYLRLAFQKLPALIDSVIAHEDSVIQCYQSQNMGSGGFGVTLRSLQHFAVILRCPLATDSTGSGATGSATSITMSSSAAEDKEAAMQSQLVQFLIASSPGGKVSVPQQPKNQSGKNIVPSSSSAAMHDESSITNAFTECKKFLHLRVFSQRYETASGGGTHVNAQTSASSSTANKENAASSFISPALGFPSAKHQFSFEQLLLNEKRVVQICHQQNKSQGKNRHHVFSSSSSSDFGETTSFLRFTKFSSSGTKKDGEKTSGKSPSSPLGLDQQRMGDPLPLDGDTAILCTFLSFQRDNNHYSDSNSQMLGGSTNDYSLFDPGKCVLLDEGNKIVEQFSTSALVNPNAGGICFGDLLKGAMAAVEEKTEDEENAADD